MCHKKIIKSSVPLILCAVALLAIGILSGATAEAAVKTKELRITQNTNFSINPFIAAGDSEFGIIWEDRSAIAVPGTVKFSRIGIDGTKIGSDVVVAKNSIPAGIVWNPDKGVFGIIRLYQLDADTDGIFFSTIKPGETWFSGNQEITGGGDWAPTTDYANRSINIIWNKSAKEYAVIYGRANIACGCDEFNLIRISSAGVVLAKKKAVFFSPLIDIEVLQPPNMPSARVDEAGNYYFIYSWRNTKTDDFELWQKKTDSTGTAIGVATRLTDNAGDSRNAWQPAETATYIWQDETRDGVDVNYFLIYLRAEGLAQDKIVSDPLLDSRVPTIVWTGKEYAMVWVQNVNKHLYFRTMSYTGTLGTIEGLSAAAQTIFFPRLAFSGQEGGRMGLVWEDSRDAAQNFEIYFALIDNTVPTISNLQITTTANSASFNWQSDESAKGGLGVWEAGQLIFSQREAGYQKTHQFTVSNLKQNTTYHYEISLEDPIGNYWEQEADFTTKEISVSAVQVSSISSHRATFTWTTEGMLDGEVQCQTGGVPPYDRIWTDPAFKTQHTLDLTGLRQNTFYNCLVRGKDQQGNITSNTAAFTTASLTTADIVSSGIGQNQATISWQTKSTNSDSVETTGEVEYGLTNAYGTKQSIVVGKSSHTVTLTNLTSEKVYHYRIKAIDPAGNEKISGDYTFTTLAGGQVPVNAVISNVTAAPNITTATITWDTDQSANSVVEYGTTVNYGNTKTVGDSVLSHNVVLSGLSANTIYHFRVQSTTAQGQTSVSSDYTFTTLTESGAGGPAGPGNLIKLPCPMGAGVNHICKRVYFWGKNNKRYVFPNEKTFYTWYSDFSTVKTVTAEQMAALVIGGNVTYRPGVKMIKIDTAKNVYVIEKGGTLRWVTTEDAAWGLYGANWNQQIDDIPDVFFFDYKVSTRNVVLGADYDKAAAMAASPDINIDKNL